MTIYQVYYWSQAFGTLASFYGTKKDALAFAKEVARVGDVSCRGLGGTVDVSRVRFPSKKAALLHYLNGVDATMAMPVDKDIASFEAFYDDEGGE
jgi:hypothetical protein|tara:strand:+ start:1381 stop:1665 length:285 start_codon:yes stop_codon:yes gene_type:complete